MVLKYMLKQCFYSSEAFGQGVPLLWKSIIDLVGFAEYNPQFQHFSRKEKWK